MEIRRNLFKKLSDKLLSREILSYAVFGLLTTLVNLLLFRGGLAMGIAYPAANLAAIIGAKVFAYVTNKLFVFRRRCESLGALLMEMLRFVFARGFTGLVDFFGLLFAVEVLRADEMISKYVLQVIVILLNYILGKAVVFRAKRTDRDTRRRKRKFLRPWRALTVWLLLFAMGFGIAAVGARIIDNDLMIFVPGRIWRIEDPDADAVYYPPLISDEAESLARGEEIARQVSAEGTVLLTNGNGALPFSPGSRLSLFSTSSVNLILGGTGAGRVDSGASDTLKEALEKEGMAVNPVLWEFYDTMPDKEKRPTKGYIQPTTQLYEADWASYPEQVLDSFSHYSDGAVVIFSRSGGEHSDIEYQQINYLALDDRERELLRQVCRLRDEGVFDRVVVVINSANTLELDFLQQFRIDACIHAGTLGQYGVNALAEILSGRTNPSGRLVDTWCYDNFSSPAMWNFTPVQYEGAEELGVPSNADTFQVYQEGIYVGYRYYETRYEDVVMGREGAGGYDYKETVAFPFGHGLSYTEFLWSDLRTAYAPESDSFSLSLTVTNRGSMPGKETVQIYGRSPYTEYDREMGVEKPAVFLCGYGKTQLLAPGESETVTVTVPRREFASFDTYGWGTYILEAGDYRLTAAANAHDAVNNLLAARGYSPENTGGAMTAPGDPSMTFLWTQEETDRETYSVSRNGTPIVPLLRDSDPNLYAGSGSTVTWLSRSDWEGTFPTAAAKLVLTELLVQDLQHNHYDPAQVDMSLYTIPVTGADNGLTLHDMMGKPYDHPDWELLLDQLTYRETVDLIRDAFHARSAIESINAPGTRDENGPTGLNTTFMAGDFTSTAFASPCVMAASFNEELIGRVGAVIANDCLRAGVSALYGPGANLHRTPYGGRNFEYYSEDPFLSAAMAAGFVSGVETLGVDTLMKHFALNECESDRQGLGVWLNEQAARELYLKAFQRSFEQAGANGVMAAYTRWGAIWSGGNRALLQGILRDEWGCDGWLITDNATTTLITVADGLRAGVTTFDASLTVALNFRQYKNDPYIRTLMREACHCNLFSLVNSSAMNGIGPDSVVHRTVFWMVSALAGLSVLCAAGGVLCALRWRRREKDWKKDPHL